MGSALTFLTQYMNEKNNLLECNVKLANLKIQKNDSETRKTKSVQWGISHHFLCVLCPVFAFCISHQARHSCENSKDFVVYFFAILIKHEICMKYEKCIVSVSYFVVCFAKNPQNAKYEKCTAGLTENLILCSVMRMKVFMVKIFECVSLNGHITNVIFIEWDKFRKMYPENQLLRGHFPNNIFHFFFVILQFFPFFNDYFFNQVAVFFVFLKILNHSKNIIRVMPFPFGKWFSGYVFQDLSILAKGRFRKCPFAETLSIICPRIG